MTNFINRGRRSGKSTMMIYTAYLTGSPIIVYDRARKLCLCEQAIKMGCKNVDVFTLEEWMRDMGSSERRKILIDEALPIIDKIMSKTLKAEVLAATLTLPMEEAPNQGEKST